MIHGFISDFYKGGCSMMLQNAFRAKRCAGWTSLFVFLAYGYRALSTAFGGDAALIAMDGQAAYQASLGRFLQPVYWLIRGRLVVPSIVVLFTAAFLTLACLLIANLFDLNGSREIALLSGLLAAHETFAVTAATYLPWMDVYALALLLSVLGASCFLSGSRKAWLSPLFFMLSLGLYQSYLPVAAVLIILVLIRRTLCGARPSRIFQTGLLACASIVAGLLLYALAFKAVLAFVGSSASYDYNGVGSLNAFDFASIPRYLLDTVLTPLRFLFMPGSEAIASHTPSISAFLNLALLLLGLIMLMPRIKQLRAGGRAMLFLLVFLLIPGGNFIQFIWQGTVSGLTIYAYVFFDVAVLLLAVSAFRMQRPLVRFAAIGAQLLLCAVILQNTLLAHQLCVKRDLEFSATMSAFTRILDEAEQVDGYVPGETPVVVVGMLPSSGISMERPGYEALSGFQGARYTYAAAYESANAWYLRMILGEHVHLVEDGVMRALSASPEAQAMPCFPSEGFCQMIDGLLYIRIS